MIIKNVGERSTLVNYIMHILRVSDKALAVRMNFIDSWKKKDNVALELFMSRHCILSKDDLKSWVDDANDYITRIRLDIVSELNKKTEREIMLIMNNKNRTDNFIEKYKVGEDDLKNDSFFQCS